VQVNFLDHLKLIVLKNKQNEHDGFLQGVLRAIKLIQTFEKLQFATDPYLGNLTVSPENLGTGITLSCKIDVSNPSLTGPRYQNALKELEQRLAYENNVKYDQDSDAIHTLTTIQYLAPNFNETQAIEDFLASIHIVIDKMKPKK